MSSRRYSTREWKKEVIKLIEAIKRWLVINITISDQCHLDQMMSLCNECEKDIHELATKDSINFRLIELQTKLIFNLVGVFQITGIEGK